MSGAFGVDAGRKQTNAEPLWREGGRQTAGEKETERETRGFMKTVDTLAALNYRADYSGRVALDSSSGSQADTAPQKPDFSN